MENLKTRPFDGSIMSNIPCPLKTASKKYKTEPAVIWHDRTISYFEYNKLAFFVSDLLKKESVSFKDRVAIIANNSFEYLILLMALIRIGAVTCPISPRFPEKTILSILNKINCSKIIDPLNLVSSSWQSKIEKIDSKKIFKDAKISPGKDNGNDTLYPNLNLNLDLNLNWDATIILTSGTTTIPKAVLHTLSNHYYSALGSNNNIPFGPGDRWLLSLPLYHVGGLGVIFRMLLSGGAVVIPSKDDSISYMLDKYRITHISIVPTQLKRLLRENLSDKTKKRLKSVLIGGSPVPFSLIKKGRKIGLPLRTTYGLTEMTSQVTTTAINDKKERLKTSGKTLDYRQIKIDDKEILVKGKTLFKGYVEGNKIIPSIDSEGWYRTGDLGHMNNDGYLTFLGRRDNLFISGGENICPEEIESVLCLLPHILQALVVPIENKEFGFRPLAFVLTEKNKKIDKKELSLHLEEYLPRFKIPEAFLNWPKESPKGNLKLDRSYFKEIVKGRDTQYL